MEYIQGDTLQALWAGNVLSPAEKHAIVEQVAAYIDQLRALEPPQNGIVASVELGKCLDYRVGDNVFGPYASDEEFHSFYRGYIPLEDCTKVYDICPRNLIVCNGKIAAIVDWQFAGWYPEYWEYTKAHFGLVDTPDWYAELRHAIPRYDDELAAERALWEQFDQPGAVDQGQQL